MYIDRMFLASPV